MRLDDYHFTWFLAQLKPNCWNVAERNLKRQGFKTFLPMAEETRQRNGRFVTAMRPVFPGYMFVGFEPARGLWRTVNSTYGITRLVSFGNAPAPVPAELVAQLRSRCDQSGKMLPQSDLKPGDQVRLTSGPFANFVAEIESIEPDRRVWVLMEIMGGDKRVAVSPGHVRAV